MQPSARARTRGLFIALWPGPAELVELQKCTGAVDWLKGAEVQGPGRLHLTLHFLGAVAADRIDGLQQVLDVPLEPFDMEFGGFEVWHRGIAVLRPTMTPAALTPYMLHWGPYCTPRRWRSMTGPIDHMSPWRALRVRQMNCGRASPGAGRLRAMRWPNLWSGMMVGTESCRATPPVRRHEVPMCYSAMIWADCRRYVREWDAKLSISEFVDLFWWKWSPEEVKRRGGKPKIPKAMEAAFSNPQTDEERQIKVFIDESNAREALDLQAEMFKQRKRLADAERTLQTKTTKKAQEDQRIATEKVGRIQGWLADLTRTELKDRDSRIFPQHYAPVMVVENGQRVVKPMRYLCRPAGSPPFFDSKFPGTYNARRDNLAGKFWKPLFGYSHGVMVVNAFYENVNLHRAQGRELAPGEEVQNQVLEFRPTPTQDMLIACLWSRWSAPGEPDLLSFAAITDEPPSEVSAAGHDRCIIPLKPENVDEWLNPGGNIARMQEILDDRQRPYFEHRLAA